MARPSIYSHGTLIAQLVVLCAAFLARGYGGTVRPLTHYGMACLAMLILLYVMQADPAPPDLRARRLMAVVLALIVGTTITFRGA